MHSERDSLERLEDAYLLRGKGQFIDDLPEPSGTLYAAIVRSPIAHGALLGVRVDRALEVPGVRGVLTFSDIEKWSAPFIVSVKTKMRQWCLAKDRVRYVGEPIAVVIAASRMQAEDGADLVELDLSPLPAVVEIESALAPTAPLLHPELELNCVLDREHVYGDVDAAFARATHTVEIETHYPRNSCTPIECGGVIATYRDYDGSYDVVSNFMGPYSLHVVMAAALQVPGNQLRHRYPPDSGGSFGVKQAMFPYVILMCLASRKVGAPVKYIEDRLEHLTAATSATSRATRLRAAVSGEGKILALDYEQIEDCGAYLRAPEPATLYRMHSCMAGPYDVGALRVRNRVVLLNKTPTGLVRGFGGPQVYFPLERLIQKIGKILGKSVPDIMAVNFVDADQFPYCTASGGVYDSGNYHGALRKLQESSEYLELLERQQEARRQGRLYGIGYAAVVEPSISNMGYITTALTPELRARAGPKNGAVAVATVSVDPSGSVCVVIGSTPAGQGHKTVAAQVVAGVLGLHRESVVVNTELDTQKDAWSPASGNYSSRFAGAVAGAVHLAAQRIRQKLARHASKLLACSPEDLVFQAEQVWSRMNTTEKITFARLAGAFHWAPSAAQIDEAMLMHKDAGVEVLRETAYFCPSTLSPPDEQDRINASATYGFILDVCGIEVDPARCHARIDRYLSLHDAGKILNPLLADGQIYGAFAQAVGASLYEEFSYDQSGNFLAGTFADYRLPTAVEVPTPKIIHLETPSPLTPLGAKGIAEGNSMSTPACIANAIADAIGYDDIQLPVFPSKIHDYLVKAGHLQEILSVTKPSSTDGSSAHSDVRPDGLDMRGEVTVAVAPEQVVEVLMSPERLARVIPGCEHLTKLPSKSQIIAYQGRAIVRVGMVKASFDVTMELSEMQLPTAFTLSGAGRGSLGNVSGRGRVLLTPVGSGTRVSYQYQVVVSGKLAAVGSRLLEGTSRLVIGQMFKALSAEANAGLGGRTESLWHRLLKFLGVRL